jgi:hypothetical protein
VHRIKTPRSLQTAEGGFAIARRDLDADTLSSSSGVAYAIGEADFSGILDLGAGLKRSGMVQKALPNTNMIVAKTLVPQLRGEIPAGETVLITAVLAQNDPEAVSAAWTTPPKPPEIAALEALVKEKGVTVSAIEAPGQMS